MNPAIASKGSSFKGAVRYITHDIGESSTDRVSGIRTLNLRTDDPEKAAKVMAWTAEHASDLKRAAGLPATGNKTKDPVYHFALTWDPSQKPDFEKMASAAGSALKELGFEGHEAVLAAHNDKAHAHIHIVVSRINPETGRAVNPNKDYERLQRWAWRYEKEHGHIYCVDRAIKYEKDPAILAELKKRQAVEHERGEQQQNKARPQWDAEREAPYPKSKAARELRDEIGRKSKELADEGRQQAGRQAAEKSELWKSYQTQKAALWAKQQAEYKAETSAALKTQTTTLRRVEATERAAQQREHRGELSALVERYRERERSQVDKLFKAQRTEFRQFLQTSHQKGFLGALSTAIQATRESSPTGERRGLVGNIASVFALTLSADARARAFLEGQKNDRERLRSQIRRQAAPSQRKEAAAIKSRQAGEQKALQNLQDARRREEEERAKSTPAYSRPVDAVRVRHVQERDALRAKYVTDKAATVTRHGEERTALKARWATLNSERKAAWTAYRQSRETESRKPTAEQGKPGAALRARFQGAERSRDAGRSNTPARSSDVGRGPSGRSGGQGRGFGPG